MVIVFRDISLFNFWNFLFIIIIDEIRLIGDLVYIVLVIDNWRVSC